MFTEVDSIARQMNATDMGGYDGFGRAIGSYFDRQDAISTGGMSYLPHACMNGGR